jgi:acyl-CoA synthetase (AMP-forming)/AMP-acid ligase II
VTHLTLIPSAIHQLVNHPETKKTDLSSVVAILSGAAYLPPELATQMVGILKKNTLDITQGVIVPERLIPCI